MTIDVCISYVSIGLSPVLLTMLCQKMFDSDFHAADCRAAQ